MLSPRFKVLLLPASFVLAVACGDDFSSQGDGVCTTKCLPTEVAVECQVGAQLTAMCGPNEDLAAANCVDSNGVSGDEIDICVSSDDEAGTTTTGWGNQIWDPELVVQLDTSTGERVVDQVFFEQFKSDSSIMDTDSTSMKLTPKGYFELSREGALSFALGWQVGDEFVSVNGLELQGFGDFVDAYEALADVSSFELTLLRDGERVVLSYRLE